MTTEEIKTLIDQKIAGQGTMVDVGSALPTILKEIVDMAGQGGAAPLVLTGNLPTGESILNACEAVGLTSDAFSALKAGEYTCVIAGSAVYNVFATSPSTGRVYVTLLSADASGLTGVYYKLTTNTTSGAVMDVDGTAKTIPFGA